MKATKAIRTMIERSGLTAIEVSQQMGRKENYISSLLSRGSSPTAETLASIAEACGWKLCLVSSETSLELDGWTVGVSSEIKVDGTSDTN